ncbi:helix-turn-helix transcriptional regulator [Sporosarcina sp. E16_8]|uniref:helix-turn-helix transcriptional regulator n=1 Tax=Sporosarcina sp. E16_8 TaxID=2789295 RepID=UPI0021071031|nr:helix-turn-helix transcriptional regulator [Sporosarcina sp. E16_8]
MSDLLLQSRMTQQELADRLGVTRQQIGTYSTGKREMTLHIAKNISYILNCNMDDLYQWDRVEERTKRR